MTYTISELHEVKCDRCKKVEKRQICIEIENPTRVQMEFIKDLEDKGWVYDDQNETHYCPKCQAKVKVK